MGYRMEVTDAVTGQSCYGTKVFGYFNDDVLASLAYLKSLNRWGKDEDGEIDLPFFEYGCDNEIRLSASEFAKFIRLYCEDMEKDNPGLWVAIPWRDMLEGIPGEIETETHWWISRIAPIYQTKNDKILRWG